MDKDKLHPIPFSFSITWELLEGIEKTALWSRLSCETFVRLAVIDRIVEIQAAMGDEE